MRTQLPWSTGLGAHINTHSPWELDSTPAWQPHGRYTAAAMCCQSSPNSAPSPLFSPSYNTLTIKPCSGVS
ncbi:unnamed protein product [Lota lota]